MTATIGSFEGTEKVASNDSGAAAHEKLGIAVRPLTPDEKQEVGHGGLVVQNVNGPAALAGDTAGRPDRQRRRRQGDDDRRS